MSEWTEIMDNVMNHVTLLKELGVRNIEIDVAVLATLPNTSSTSPAVLTPPARNSTVKPATAPQPLSTAIQPPTSAVASVPNKITITDITQRITACEACRLHTNRTHTVPGQGNTARPDVMFIGDTLGAEEDQQGLAFVGPAGTLLTKMISAMGYTRADVFITTICKCHPPAHEPPSLEEMRCCLPFLREQIQTIKPKTIVLLGGQVLKILLENQQRVSRVSGQWTAYNGIPVMPTFDPYYILRFESNGDATSLKNAKLEVWTALKLVLTQLGKKVPVSAASTHEKTRK